MAVNDFRIGECDTCKGHFDDLTWGEKFPARHCKKCYREENLCDWCLKKQNKLYEQVSEWNPDVTHRYCKDCDQMLKEDNLARRAGCFISRHGPYEGNMRMWWSMQRQNEVRERMTPDVIERVEQDIANLILRKDADELRQRTDHRGDDRKR